MGKNINIGNRVEVKFSGEVEDAYFDDDGRLHTVYVRDDFGEADWFDLDRSSVTRVNDTNPAAEAEES